MLEGLTSEDISYETWPWTLQTSGHLSLGLPKVWEKEPFHGGKRMVLTEVSRVVLMTEVEFQDSMQEARKFMGVPTASSTNN